MGFLNIFNKYPFIYLKRFKYIGRVFRFLAVFKRFKFLVTKFKNMFSMIFTPLKKLKGVISFGKKNSKKSQDKISKLEKDKHVKNEKNKIIDKGNKNMGKIFFKKEKISKSSPIKTNKKKNEIKNLVRDVTSARQKFAYNSLYSVNKTIMGKNKKEKISSKRIIEEIILLDQYDNKLNSWFIKNKSAILIGKNSKNGEVDIDLSKLENSEVISRNHSVLNNTGSSWYLEDLGSSNGTFVLFDESKQKIKIREGRPVKLSYNDVVFIATTKFLLR